MMMKCRSEVRPARTHEHTRGRGECFNPCENVAHLSAELAPQRSESARWAGPNQTHLGGLVMLKIVGWLQSRETTCAAGYVLE